MWGRVRAGDLAQQWTVNEFCPLFLILTLMMDRKIIFGVFTLKLEL